MAKVVWTEAALSDLHDIMEYIAKDSAVYAERLGTRVVQAPRRLQQSPRSGRIVPEFNDQTIREIIYGSYRIIYKSKDQACFIVAVIHGSRDILKHLKPGEWNIE
jgi:plasmid stabilization system protein ParE